MLSKMQAEHDKARPPGFVLKNALIFKRGPSKKYTRRCASAFLTHSCYFRTLTQKKMEQSKGTFLSLIFIQ